MSVSCVNSLNYAVSYLCPALSLSLPLYILPCRAPGGRWSWLCAESWLSADTWYTRRTKAFKERIRKRLVHHPSSKHSNLSTSAGQYHSIKSAAKIIGDLSNSKVNLVILHCMGETAALWLPVLCPYPGHEAYPISVTLFFVYFPSFCSLRCFLKIL